MNDYIFTVSKVTILLTFSLQFHLVVRWCSVGSSHFILRRISPIPDTKLSEREFLWKRDLLLNRISSSNRCHSAFFLHRLQRKVRDVFFWRKLLEPREFYKPFNLSTVIRRAIWSFIWIPKMPGCIHFLKTGFHIRWTRSAFSFDFVRAFCF